MDILEVLVKGRKCKMPSKTMALRAFRCHQTNLSEISEGYLTDKATFLRYFSRVETS
jgi:hypothetical protein